MNSQVSYTIKSGKSTIILLLSILICLLFQTAITPTFAYEVDVHFYETYLMARYAGIKHEVAINLASFNQYTDENFKTGPKGYSYSRRIFHFPTDVLTYDSSGLAKGIVRSRFEGAPVTRNTSTANELFMEGLSKGNKYLVSTGLHVLQDSYGHEGYYALAGHATSGYWPDRVWWRPEVHEEMNETLFKAMIAIRKALPESALDKTFSSDKTSFNYNLSAKDLFNLYKNDTEIQDAIHFNPFLSAEYKTQAIKTILENAQKKGILLPNFGISLALQNPDLSDQTKDVRQVLTNIFTNTLKTGNFETFVDNNNLAKAFNLSPETLKYQQQTTDLFAENLVELLTDKIIPKELNAKTNANTIESNNALRTIENNQRVNKWREVIKRETGSDIYWPIEGKIAENLPDDCIIARITPDELQEWKKAINRYKWWSPLSKRGQYLLVSDSSGRETKDHPIFNWHLQARSKETNLEYQIPDKIDQLIAEKKVQMIMTNEQVMALNKDGTAIMTSGECLTWTLLKVLNLP